MKLTVMFVAIYLVNIAAFSPAYSQDKNQPVTVTSPERTGSAHYTDQRLYDAYEPFGLAGAYRAGDFVYLQLPISGAWRKQWRFEELRKPIQCTLQAGVVDLKVVIGVFIRSEGI